MRRFCHHQWTWNKSDKRKSAESKMCYMNDKSILQESEHAEEQFNKPRLRLVTWWPADNVSGHNRRRRRGRGRGHGEDVGQAAQVGNSWKLCVPPTHLIREAHNLLWPVGGSTSDPNTHIANYKTSAIYLNKKAFSFQLSTQMETSDFIVKVDPFLYVFFFVTGDIIFIELSFYWITVKLSSIILVYTSE